MNSKIIPQKLRYIILIPTLYNIHCHIRRKGKDKRVLENQRIVS